MVVQIWSGANASHWEDAMAMAVGCSPDGDLVFVNP
jgi:hypothetical protein